MYVYVCVSNSVELNLSTVTMVQFFPCHPQVHTSLYCHSMSTLDMSMDVLQLVLSYHSVSCYTIQELLIVSKVAAHTDCLGTDLCYGMRITVATVS